MESKNGKPYMQYSRERERVNSTASEWRITGALIVVLFAIVGICCYFGIQNSANAVPQSVNFNAVTIRNGAKINVNSNKSLTSVDGGNKLVADNTSTNTVKGDGISSAVSSFASSNYGSDPLFSTNTANAGKLLSEAECSAFSPYLSTVTSEYWLSDTGSRGTITWQSYAKSDNTLVDNTLKATGRVDGSDYDETALARGSYAFNKDVSLTNYTASAGAIWGLSATDTADFLGCYVNNTWFSNGTAVYNNPQCLESGNDPISGKPYKKSVIQNLVSGSGRKAFGYVSDDGHRIVQLRVGQKIPAGKVVVFAFMSVHHEIKDPTGFLIPDRYYGTGPWASASYIGFIKTNVDITATGRTGGTHPIYGVMKNYSQDTPITAAQIESASKAVRPAYSLTTGNVAFVRSNTSNATLTTSSKFGDLSTSGANYNENKKVVVKSSNTTIRSNVSSSSNLSVSGTGGTASYSSSNSTISVPYGATSLTLNSSSFTTSNANYISALANTNTGTLKYAVLARNGSSATLDLTSIINNTQIGSKATISFYAEQANAANNSDAISAIPVTFDISVVAGANQTITYRRGEGTSGTAPSQATVRAGQSYSFADGIGLSKDGNPFSCWEVTYTKYGQTSSTTRYISGGQSIIVPEATTGNITATALYGGFKATKSTQSTPTVVTVTWDANAPGDFKATFEGTGTFNDEKTKRYDKSLVNGTVTAPASPVLSGGTGTRIFDGWNTKQDGTGTTLKENEVTSALTTNTIYYAQWSEGYKVTYVVTGGPGASQTGKWADGTVTDVEELVLPGASTKGPSNGTPVASNSSYMFYGWYTGINGNGSRISAGISFRDLGGNMTVYAYYVLPNTFLAPATSTVTANPRNISGTKYSIAEVKAAATSIKDGTNPDSNIYNATNDKYHLYTLLKDSSGNYLSASQTDSWAEFRIIGVGGHDDDGSGLTFQMVHALPDRYAYDSAGKTGSSLNWALSSLRPSLQTGGSIYKKFDDQLTNRIRNVAKKFNTTAGSPSGVSSTTDAFTILSYTEYQKSVQTAYWTTGKVGSSYAFWNQFSIPNDSSASVTQLQKLAKTRSGSDLGYAWQRSVSPNMSDSVLILYSNGIFLSYNGSTQTYSMGVPLSFSF